MPNLVPTSPPDASDRFAIVVAEWNRSITDKLLQGALETLRAASVDDSQIEVAWVPGSWEIPIVAQRFAQSGNYSGIVCLGAVIRGETSHDQHLNRGVSLGLMEISLANDLPIMFGVLTCESMEQAIHRSGGNVGNKGTECAEAVLKMAGLLKNCPPE
ncbi:MAG: 6,7-dimethyl-8-ribityllumazine synthase [Planctomycetes bacterium]|nr:6,7-dimethyl-8-ribityllumazine synthase [Planctomycetota bacterium]